MITADPIANEGVTRSMSVSRLTSLCSSRATGFSKLIAIIANRMIANVIVILSRKGISGKVNFKTVDTGIVNNVPVNAAADVVLFQKIPSKKIASTPGDIKPTYSCMNWYA